MEAEGARHSLAQPLSRVPLQRGRLTMEAEGCTTRRTRWCRSCFNGAAYRRRRKGEVHLFADVGDAVASTGPPHDGGGRRVKLFRIAGDLAIASTGPPHEGGGRRRDWRRRAMHTPSLQRGRLTMEAEGLILVDSVSATIRLQRGRLTKEAEGNTTRGSPYRRRTCFNGAASRRKRKAPQTIRPPLSPSRASTGPPHEGNGREDKELEGGYE